MREELIYLAGLLATDGSISPNHGIGVRFYFYSSNEEFIRFVAQKLNKIGIESTIKLYAAGSTKFSTYCHYLYLKNPHFIRDLLLEYSSDYLHPKHLKILREAYPSVNRTTWLPNEIQTLKDNYGKIPLWKISSLIGRGRQSTNHKAIKLIKMGELESCGHRGFYSYRGN